MSRSAGANAVDLYLDRHLREGRGSRRAILTRDSALTFAEVLDRVEAAAGALHGVGVDVGDRVVLVLPDTPDAVAFLLAAIRIGAMPAPLHVGLTDQEYATIYADCEPAATVVSAGHAERLARLGPVAERRTPVLVPERIDLAAAPRRGPAAVHPDDPALLQYTSGSTGAPKGVVHRHAALRALLDGFPRYLELAPDDICFSAAKLFFGYGLGNSLLFPLGAGCAAFLRAEPSDPVGVLRDVDAMRPSVFYGGPALYTAILTLIGPETRFDLSSVRLFVSAGEALAPHVFERWRDRFGAEILDGLGSTECLHVFAAGRPGHLAPGRLGPAVPQHEIRIVDGAGQAVEPGEPGIAEVSGPAVSREYWNRPEETTRTMAAGRVRTGDVLREHREGWLEYVGREDDVFKVRGMKVAPLEIEQVLASHPDVRECAVVPGTDRWGIQTVHAVVCLEPSREPDEESSRAIRSYLRERLPRHKVPQTIDFVDGLPRNSTGKLARRRLSQDQEAR